jgi:hypothetical protein
MAKLTNAQKMVENLLKLGCKEVPCRSGKYRQFTRFDKEGEFFFVGVKGALRAGKVATKSITLSHTNFAKKLVEEVIYENVKE